MPHTQTQTQTHTCASGISLTRYSFGKLRVTITIRCEFCFISPIHKPVRLTCIQKFLCIQKTLIWLFFQFAEVVLFEINAPWKLVESRHIYTGRVKATLSQDQVEQAYRYLCLYIQMYIYIYVYVTRNMWVFCITKVYITDICCVDNLSNTKTNKRRIIKYKKITFSFVK